VNLRTFLPPPAVPTATTPAVGDPAPAREELGVEGRAALICFLRHTGCPFAEETLRRLRELDTDVARVAVTHSTEPQSAAWLEQVGGADGVELRCDPQRALYAAWGLGRTSMSHFLGRDSLRGVTRLARQGVRNRHPEGSRWQSAGTFAVDAAGVVRYVHVPAHAGDLPDLRAALSPLAARAGERTS
jgi:hypothetical protein